MSKDWKPNHGIAYLVFGALEDVDEHVDGDVEVRWWDQPFSKEIIVRNGDSERRFIVRVSERRL